MSVLLVEDERNLADAIVDYLALEGIPCDYADNGVMALELLCQHPYQMVILDINLPRLDGVTVCQRLRVAGERIPILFLTAKDTLEDKLAGFDAGGDDYLIKPFAMAELIARVKALSGRLSPQARRLQVADLSLDLNLHQARRGQRELALSPTGLALLEQLLRAAPAPVSKAALIDAIWGAEGDDNNSLKVHIHKLRKAIDRPEEVPLLRTIKSHGYAIKAPE
ncbi:response regulator transcription factor [Ferrimonas pelagia]|uniref:Cationic peptide response regulator transcription factor CprR n=1 Tax=Ferrimonas pelagia TaxID=1177826 RepID=A0ABP9FCW1_9GAMM